MGHIFLFIAILEKGGIKKMFKNKKILDMNRIPKHIAFIMDGNGRWAKKRGLPRTKGHEQGAKTIEKVADGAKRLGVQAITLYAFSTENWKRPKEEVDYIFSLFKKFLIEGKDEFKKKDIRIHFIGDIDGLDSEMSMLMKETMEETKSNKGIILNLAINYGGRNEIVDVVKKISRDCIEGKCNVNDINEEFIEEYLMTKDLPPIDLMVRTSGEIRLSNFLLWQLAYSEFVFSSVYWPDFDDKELENVIIEYQSRDRRFGGLK
jgi:undecaprenyl diphosphate synthase